MKLKRKVKVYKKTLDKEIERRLVANAGFTDVTPQVWRHTQRYSRWLMQFFRFNGYSQRGKKGDPKELTPWRKAALKDSQKSYRTLDASWRLAIASVIIEMTIRHRIHKNTKSKVFSTLNI